MRSPRAALLFALLLGAASAERATADEWRLRDGEVLHGAGREEPGGARWRVATATGERLIRGKDVAERIEAPAPEAVLAEREAVLAEDDADRRVTLALWAWQRRRDAAALRLAEAALTIDPEHAAAHAFLGHVRGPEGWRPGLPAPRGARGQVGPRWGEAARRAARGGKHGALAEEALAWLAAHQDEDGRIDADAFDRHCPDGDRCDGRGGGHHGERMPCAFDGVTTALALLAWSAHGSTLDAGPHRGSVRRGTAFCRQVVERGPVGFDSIWNVAFAVEALADVCAASREPDLLPVVAEGVRRLEAEQRPDGGYSYVYAIGDVPTTAAVLRALGQAAQTGVAVDAERIERALVFLDERVEAATGRSEYHEGAEQKGYTPTRANAAASLAARRAVGRLEDAPERGRQVAAVRDPKPRWTSTEKQIRTRDGRVVTAQVGSLYPYLWYLADLALLEDGGASRGSWRAALGGALAKGQVRDGHAAGSWPPRGPYSLSGGRAFVTGMGALMLLSPHRYPRER